MPKLRDLVPRRPTGSKKAASKNQAQEDIDDIDEIFKIFNRN